MHYKLNHTQKSRKGNNSSYCVVGVVYNEITSCLKSFCSTGKNRTETARVSVLFFVQRSIVVPSFSLYFWLPVLLYQNENET